jgi:hypothetical protein
MATLVLSDLHLGTPGGRDLLRRAAVRERLWQRMDGIDRVVLLGDTLELRQATLAAGLRAARPFFEELGTVLGDGEVVLVPGNHDHRLLAAWHDQRRQAGAALGLEQRMAAGEHGPAGTLAAWLAPARLTLAYPGLRLRPDVYAMHGHYLDRHLTVPTLERLAIGAMTRLVGPLPERAGPEDYEAALAPLYALAHELAQAKGKAPRLPGALPPGESTSFPRPSTRLWRLLGPGRGDRPPRLAGLGPALPPVVALLNLLGLGPLRAEAGAGDLLPAALRAMGEVCVRLRLDVPYVVFGHAHRSGPGPHDDPVAWTAPTGTRLVNTGSWVEEPKLRDAGVPYRPGTCVRLEETGPPRILRVLDGPAGAGLLHERHLRPALSMGLTR